MTIFTNFVYFYQMDTYTSYVLNQNFLSCSKFEIALDSLYCGKWKKSSGQAVTVLDLNPS